ncbi:hypothetical protein LOZ35_006771 [Ophidiomyces ophidiicola]|nr:hypothetical protein LOZ35_006771 [Ophidiomyces ophidiicola]
MLAAPAKSAKRLSSLFSLGSSRPKDDSKPPRSHAASHSQSQSPSPSQSQSPHATAARHGPSASQPALRHSASVQDLHNKTTSTPRNVSAPLPSCEFLPPPALAMVNPSVAAADPLDDSRQRPQSWATNFSRPMSACEPLPTPKPPKTRSWVPGKLRKASDAMPNPAQKMRAWVAGTPQDIPYDVDRLVAGDKVSLSRRQQQQSPPCQPDGLTTHSPQVYELWDDQGDTYVYLFPPSTGRPPSFKVHSAAFAASPALTIMARGADPAALPDRPAARPPQLHLSVPMSPPVSPPHGSLDGSQDGSDGRRSRDYLLDESAQELHLFLPVPFVSDVSGPQPMLHDEDVDMLVLFRNIFAFLVGQSLIATPRCPSVFAIFMEIAGLLERFGFSNLDGSTFGETAISSFACYCDELGLSDVRRSSEKTLQAIVLGERMRYLPLYQEGFSHGVGKLDDIKLCDGSKYALVTKLTQKRMERGYLDLENRLKVAREKLDDFDFPQLFSGFANSNVMNEARLISFKNWKNAYVAFRKHVMSYYRARFGSWPPRANSKKNQFEESGLNRLVLRELYRDFTDLYDMLVDRTSLTTRSSDMNLTGLEGDGVDAQEPSVRALRQLMSEFDRSTPPVAPPIPFDIPLRPTIRSIKRRLDPKKEPKERAKKLSAGEINEILLAGYNHKSMKPTPFLESFTQFERRVGSGKNTDELVDNRCGQWLFMYAVLQSLPMVIVDAPDVKFSDGVEYFLCIPPRGGSPWCKDDPRSGRSWFGVAGGAGVVNLPSDVVANGVEGVYRRSHCWQVASRWADQHQLLSPAMQHHDFAPNHNIHSAGTGTGTASGSGPGTPASPYQPPFIAPPLSSTESNSDRQPTPLLTPGTITPPMFSLPLPHPGFAARAGNRSSIHMGIEALPLPAGVAPMEPLPARPLSHNPNLSFDQILGGMPQQQQQQQQRGRR